MRLRISHVISKKYSNGILNLHVHVEEGTCNNVWRIFRKCLFGLSPIGGEFLT